MTKTNPVGQNKIGNPSKRTASPKALLLFSGGLDSILAARILKDQGVKITALAFTSHFFNADQAKKSAKENKIVLMTEDISGKHLEAVKNPEHGYGSGMNPCIDCHLLMLKEAKKIAARDNFDIIATGEVLGQRPMSQNAEALKLIERLAGLTGLVLRPLSAKVLPQTKYEKQGLVIRENLFGFSGRSRKDQIALAKEFKIKKYPSPAGGCILTDKEYSKKLGDLLQKTLKQDAEDFELLRVGRHFWSGKTRVVLGRNHEENLKLKKLAGKNDILLELKKIPGPLALVRGREKKKAGELAKEKILKYSKKANARHSRFEKVKIWAAGHGSLTAFFLATYLVLGVAVNPGILKKDLNDKYGKVAGAVSVHLTVRGVPVEPDITASDECDGSSPYVLLDWQKDLGVDTYDVYRDEEILVSDLTSAHYWDNDVNSGNSYTYYVMAIGPTGVGQSDSVSVDVGDCEVTEETTTEETIVTPLTSEPTLPGQEEQAPQPPPPPPGKRMSLIEPGIETPYGQLVSYFGWLSMILLLSFGGFSFFFFREFFLAWKSDADVTEIDLVDKKMIE